MGNIKAGGTKDVCAFIYVHPHITENSFRAEGCQTAVSGHNYSHYGSVTVTKYLRQEDKKIFLLTVSEVSFHHHLTLLLWTCDEHLRGEGTLDLSVFTEVDRKEREKE